MFELSCCTMSERQAELIASGTISADTVWVTTRAYLVDMSWWKPFYKMLKDTEAKYGDIVKCEIIDEDEYKKVFSVTAKGTEEQRSGVFEFLPDDYSDEVENNPNVEQLYCHGEFGYYNKDGELMHDW